MKAGLPSREGYTIPQFVEFFFTVARFGLFALIMSGDYISDLLVSGGNIG